MMRLLRNYFFWSYERGSIHYDIMVTAILIFVFVGPRFIDFKDKPVASVPLRSREVLVKSTGAKGDIFTYEVRADDLGGASTEDEIRAALLRIIEPISGDVALEGYQPVLDTRGKVVAYEATVRH
jgi:hypothetical protein